MGHVVQRALAARCGVGDGIARCSRFPPLSLSLAGVAAQSVHPRGWASAPSRIEAGLRRETRDSSHLVSEPRRLLPQRWICALLTQALALEHTRAAWHLVVHLPWARGDDVVLHELAPGAKSSQRPGTSFAAPLLDHPTPPHPAVRQAALAMVPQRRPPTTRTVDPGALLALAVVERPLTWRSCGCYRPAAACVTSVDALLLPPRRVDPAWRRRCCCWLRWRWVSRHHLASLCTACHRYGQ